MTPPMTPPDVVLRRKMERELGERALFDAAHARALAYLDGVGERAVGPTAQAVDALAEFDEALPTHSGEAGAVLAQLDRVGGPATTALMGPRYFGFVTGGALPVTLAARWLADSWDQNAALHLTSPIAAKLEAVSERWLCELFGLPTDSVAGFVSGTSTAIFCGLVAARYRLLANQGWDVNRNGLNGAPRLRVITGRAAHGAVIKSLALAGFGTDCIEYVETDANGQLEAAAMPALDARCLVILQAGNVNTGGFDPFDAVGKLAHAAGAWVHIDGAFGLWAAACARTAALTAGMTRAHSWSVDGHKTLNTPYDSGVVLCADRDALAAALQAGGDYLHWSEARDGMRYTPEMSRRARGIELWAALKYLGREGLDAMIGGLVERALEFAAALRREGFEICNRVVFNQVLVACGSDAQTERVLAAIQRDGTAWMGGSKFAGRSVIRLSVCSWRTAPADVERTVAAMVRARQAVAG